MPDTSSLIHTPPVCAMQRFVRLRRLDQARPAPRGHRSRSDGDAALRGYGRRNSTSVPVRRLWHSPSPSRDTCAPGDGRRSWNRAPAGSCTIWRCGVYPMSISRCDGGSRRPGRPPLRRSSTRHVIPVTSLPTSGPQVLESYPMRPTRAHEPTTRLTSVPAARRAFSFDT